MKVQPLSEDLEHALLNAIIGGVVSRDTVQAQEVSKLGRLVLSAVSSLVDGGGTPPFNYGSLLLCCSEVHGADKASVKEYLRRVHDAGVGVEVGDILQKVRDKQLLVDLINEAGGQLSRGTLDVALIGGLLQREARPGSNDLLSVAERVKNGLPDPPHGLQFKSMPKLCKATGGVIGVWVIAGQPGIGKSTMGWQLVLDITATEDIPAVVYDFENGFAALMDHTREIFKGDLDKIRHATRSIYIRDSIRTLDADLGRIAPPAVVLVDSVQKLPGSVENRRHGLDRWVHRLEALKKRGYYVIMISEIGRAAYEGDASISAFKETGEIEYSADAGIQLISQTDDYVEAHLVKNRHRPKKGFVSHLQRKNAWLFREVGDEDKKEID